MENLVALAAFLENYRGMVSLDLYVKQDINRRERILEIQGKVPKTLSQGTLASHPALG